MSSWAGQPAQFIEFLFASAIARAPSIIFLDEIDAIVAGPDGKQMDETQNTLALLAGILSIIGHNKKESRRVESGTNADGAKRVLLIGTTIRPQVLPVRIVQREGINLVAVDLPTTDDRCKLVAHFLKGTSCAILERVGVELAYACYEILLANSFYTGNPRGVHTLVH